MQDFASITISERIVQTIYTIIFFYLFVFIFADVTSMISDTARGLMANLQKNYEETMKAVNADKLPKTLVRKIKRFFEYIWIDNRGVDERLLEELPDTIHSDIILNLYETSFKNSRLFGSNSTTEFDKSSAASFVRAGKIDRYLKGDVIAKAGSKLRKAWFVLEGELVVVGVNGEPLCKITPGSWYNPKICEEDNDLQQISPAYLISTQVTRTLVIDDEKLKMLFNAYFLTKEGFYEGNKVVMDKCMSVLKSKLISSGIFPYTIETLVESEYANLSSSKLAELISAASNAAGLDVPTATELIERSMGGNVSEEVQRDISLDSNGKLSGIPKVKHSYFIKPNSTYYTLIYVLHLVAIITTATVVPLEIVIPDEESWPFLFIEILCIIESVFHIIIRFRTPVLMRGPTTSYNFCDIFRYYKDNGFWIDIFGVIPLNCIFAQLGIFEPLWIIVPLRLIRVVTILNTTKIIPVIKLKYHGLSSTCDLFSILLAYFLLWHWISCFWLFLTFQIEEGAELTWHSLLQITDSSNTIKYINSIYFTIKAVAGITSGETVPINFLERIFTYIYLRIGDFIFAVLFGLIAAFAASISAEDSKEAIQDAKAEEFSKQFKLSIVNKSRVKRYFEFLANVTYVSNISDSVKEQLPRPFVKEILYELNKPLVEPMFIKFATDAFIRKLACHLEEACYMPGDYIVRKGEVGDEMYFLTEGRVAIVASNKRTVFKRLYNGSYFGDIALFMDSKRICHVRAETCCSVCILKRKIIDNVKQRFKEISGKIAEIGEEKTAEFKRKDTKGSEICESEMDYVLQQNETRKHKSTTIVVRPLIKLDKCDSQNISDNDEKEETKTKKIMRRVSANVLTMKSIHDSPNEMKRIFTTKNTMKKAKSTKIKRRLSQLNCIKKIEDKIHETGKIPMKKIVSDAFSIYKGDIEGED